MSSANAPTTHPRYQPWLAGFCWAALLWTVLVFQAGGFTTSINAGMAFLDWPLSNGSVNPHNWLHEPDMLAEHSHRIFATIQGLLTLAVSGALLLVERRRWLRRLGLVAVGLVVFQGVLGGLRVLLDQQNTQSEDNFVATVFRVAHGVTAQVYLCVLVAIALATTRRWIERSGGLLREPSGALRRAGLIACGVVIVQLVLGAIMRHNGAGLAIGTFPLNPDGTLIPPAWGFHVGIHFAHRAWAIVVAVSLIYFAGRLWGARHLGRVLAAGAAGLMGLLAVQVYLGALVIWTTRNPHAATMHVLTGAFLLATCWGLTFLCHRFRLADTPQEVPVDTVVRPSAPTTPARA
jgi:cytochrome c oxidase assembly protein subunit 15